MTAKWFSHIPGHPYPKHEARFPSSQAVADYFERHARQDGIDLRLDTNVKRIQASAGGWQLATSHGAIDAGHVVVATGYAHTPYVPNWPGVQRFGGEVLHSSLYERRQAYRGKRMLVVGAGPSGLQVAHDLAAVAAEVWLAVRTPPNIFARHRCWGNSVDVLAGPLFHAPVRAADGIARFIQRRTVGDLSKHGLPLPRLGPFTSAARNQPVTVVDMEVIASLRDRRIAVVSTVDRFHDAGVSLADGTRLRPDVVICATGYRTGLEPLVGHLGVLDARRCAGQARARTSRKPAVVHRLSATPKFDRPRRQTVPRSRQPNRASTCVRSGAVPRADHHPPDSVGDRNRQAASTPARRSATGIASTLSSQGLTWHCPQLATSDRERIRPYEPGHNADGAASRRAPR